MPGKVIRARNGFGSTPNGSWTLLTGDNASRRWLSVEVPADAGDAVYLALTYGSDVTSGQFGLVQVEKGGAAVFSVTGDMPWQGSVLATGVDANSEVVWTEVYEDD